jgi:hypothetical protein
MAGHGGAADSRCGARYTIRRNLNDVVNDSRGSETPDTPRPGRQVARVHSVQPE